MNFFLIPILLCPLLSIAQLKVADIFSDNMLLQRGTPIKVWGKGTPGRSVNVLFSEEKRTTKVTNDSVWIVTFPKQKATTHSQTLTVTIGTERIEFNNILIGDIWICIGQSNMEWPMVREQHFKDEIHNSNQPNIRLLNPPATGRNVFGVSYTDSLINRLTTEKFYAWNGWQSCDSSSVRLMSAVAYYFAKMVFSETGVPIGIVNLSIGGAPLETFISTEALLQHETFSKKANGNWLSNDALPIWIRQRGTQNVGNNYKVPADELGPNHAYKPGFAYKAGIEPLFRFGIKGILNYQGESNAQAKERVEEYAALSVLMINHYRSKWKKNLPYYFVQLSSIDTVHYNAQLWPQFRNEQRKMLTLIPNSGMAVSSDQGSVNDVHPTNKKAVGERLAKWALYQTYKRPIIPSGPLPLKAVYKNRQVIISFRYADGLQTTALQPLNGFSVDGKTIIDAMISSNKVIIPVKEKPAFVYYGWQPFNTGNLINKEQLPASTFQLQVQ